MTTIPGTGPAFLIRQPKHLLLLWLLLLAAAVAAVVTADGWSWRLVPAIGLAAVAGYEIAKNLVASIRVGPTDIVFKGLRRQETIAIDDFVTIERRSWWQPKPLTITTTGTTWAPWWHPSLAAAVRVAIEDVKKEVAAES